MEGRWGSKSRGEKKKERKQMQAYTIKIRKDFAIVWGCDTRSSSFIGCLEQNLPFFLGHLVDSSSGSYFVRLQACLPLRERKKQVWVLAMHLEKGEELNCFYDNLDDFIHLQSILHSCSCAGPRAGGRGQGAGGPPALRLWGAGEISASLVQCSPGSKWNASNSEHFQFQNAGRGIHNCRQ